MEGCKSKDVQKEATYEICWDVCKIRTADGFSWDARISMLHNKGYFLSLITAIFCHVAKRKNDNKDLSAEEKEIIAKKVNERYGANIRNGIEKDEQSTDTAAEIIAGLQLAILKNR